jgi:uncharacterized membrane protein YhaH (DUF805 family)
MLLRREDLQILARNTATRERHVPSDLDFTYYHTHFFAVILSYSFIAVYTGFLLSILYAISLYNALCVTVERWHAGGRSNGFL